MPEEKIETPEEKKERQLGELKKGIKKKDKTSLLETVKLIATRDKLERDYKEDLLTVNFNTSLETTRSVQSKRPTQKEMMMIMRLSAEAAIYEGKMDAESLKRMVDIYEKLPTLAADLCVDKKLTKDFWTNSVSFSTLQNFITEVIGVTQRGTGVTAEEIDSFR